MDLTNILFQMKGVTVAKPCLIKFVLFQNINDTPTTVSKSTQNIWRFCFCRALARYLEYHCWHSNFAIAAQVGHFAGGYSEYQGTGIGQGPLTTYPPSGAGSCIGNFTDSNQFTLFQYLAMLAKLSAFNDRV